MTAGICSGRTIVFELVRLMV
ncbi:hypothetical protein SBBP2_290012 [Burkholderiales bacterium]|nr:hypothetical protein SBBP2_290012 [Burkholderiales bacterium]